MWRLRYSGIISILKIMSYKIPFNRPSFLGNEQVYIAKAIANGHISGDGPFTKKCQQLIQEVLGVPKVLLTPSCTHALEMAALLLDLHPGDEIIVPSFTFVSTVNAFVLRQAKPVFIDIRADTLNLDENQLEGLVTSKTKAIVVVHYAGIGCEMDTVIDVCKRFNIPVIEDNALGLFGKYKGRYLGTFGCLATQSFHETKNFTCGEGGALLINDPKYIERAEIIREKGTNRSKFFRGQVDKYSWVDIGSSYLLSDISAAFLYAQLEFIEEIQNKRKQIWDYYYIQLKDWAAENAVQLPIVPSYCEQSYHMFYIVLPVKEQRQMLIEQLKTQGILAVFHYLPLHLSQMGRRFGGKQGDCPVTEEVSEKILRLPLYNSININDQDRVIETILNFKCN